MLGADGAFYGYNNNRSIERVNGMMDAALAKFAARPAAASAPVALARAPWARRPPEGASLARVYARITPLPAGASEANGRLARDHLWITADEIAALLHAAEPEPTGGAWPASLAARLARYHLLDNIRGEPDFWKPEEVRTLELRAWRVHADESVAHVAVVGRFELGSADGQRGFCGGLRGRMVIDTQRRRAMSVDIYACGEAWGSGTWTPGAPPGRFPLRLAIIEATDDVARLVPPQAAQCGEEYFSPQVAR